MISKKNLTKSDIKKLLNDKFFKKVFIITGKNSFFKSGANIFFKKLISDKQTKIFFKSSSLPEINELRSIINSIKEFQPQLLIAIGGGAVMDYAKIANLKNIEKNLSQNIKRNNHQNLRISKLIAVPTTAGSGAEVTSNAVIYINKIKYSIEGKGVLPNYFFLNYDFILSNSKKLKSSSGFDAISQAVESIISVKSNNKSLLYAKKSLLISTKNYIKFVKKPNKNNANLMSLAAMYSGQAINISKTTAPHAVSYPFSALYNISHGHAVSLTLEKFLKFNYLNINKSVCDFDLNKRYSIIFDIFKVNKIDELVKTLKHIKTQANLTDNFKDLNIDIKNNYHQILDGINIQRLKNNPIKLEKRDIKSIILDNEN